MPELKQWYFELHSALLATDSPTSFSFKIPNMQSQEWNLPNITSKLKSKGANKLRIIAPKIQQWLFNFKKMRSD